MLVNIHEKNININIGTARKKTKLSTWHKKFAPERF